MPRACRSRACRTRASSQPRAIWASSDPALLQRALRNLIENALAYTRTGGILIGARIRGERVRIDVVDTGVGVPDDQQQQIFEEFYQVQHPGRTPGEASLDEMEALWNEAKTTERAR